MTKSFFLIESHGSVEMIVRRLSRCTKRKKSLPLPLRSIYQRQEGGYDIGGYHVLAEWLTRIETDEARIEEARKNLKKKEPESCSGADCLKKTTHKMQ